MPDRLAPPGSPPAPARETRPVDAAGRRAGRLLSLDAFRGFAVGYMILSFSMPPVARHEQMEHAAWNGWHLEDVFAPMFLFVMGTGLAFLLGRYTGDRRALAGRIARRAAVLVALGVFVNMIIDGWPPPGEIRIMGVLQRIALAYLVAALVALAVPLRWQVPLAAAVLLGWWAALTQVPVPGHGAGVLTPEGNIAGWIDRSILGASHVYQGGPMDPEGFMTTLPAAVSVLAGVWAGRFLRSAPRTARTAALLAAAGVAAYALAHLWSLALPFNKRLWTGSFALLTIGMAAMGQALAFWLVDVRGHRRGVATFFEVMGRNVLFVYVAVLLAVALLSLPRAGGEPLYAWIYGTLVEPWAEPLAGEKNAGVLFGIVMIGPWWLLLRAMYRRGIFLRA